jgi:phosphoketolase
MKLNPRETDRPLDPYVAAEGARHCRESDPELARWASGYGPIRYSDLTQWRMYRAVDRLGRAGIGGDGVPPFVLLRAADHLASAGMWLTSHTWESAKNEQSHQDPTLCEALFGELSHLSRVLIPPDSNGAAALMEEVYRTHGQIWTIVAPKPGVPDLVTVEEARQLLADGAMEMRFAGFRREEADLVIIAIGAYQLEQVLRASFRLQDREVPHRVVYMLEPGRFRNPRSEREARHAARAELVEALFPDSAPYRLFVTHTRPEPLLGLLAPLHTGSKTTGLGYVSLGGTLTVDGLLFRNRCTYAHVLRAVAGQKGADEALTLSTEEREALDGRRQPKGVILP